MLQGGGFSVLPPCDNFKPFSFVEEVVMDIYKLQRNLSILGLIIAGSISANSIFRLFILNPTVPLDRRVIINLWLDLIIFSFGAICSVVILLTIRHRVKGKENETKLMGETPQKNTDDEKE